MFTNNFHLHKLKHQLHYTFRSKREIKSMKKKNAGKCTPLQFMDLRVKVGRKKFGKKKFQQKVLERGLTPPPICKFSDHVFFEDKF